MLLPTIESLQSQLPGRSCAVADVVANVVGAGVGLAIGWALTRRPLGR